jgi:hypothetical protein
MLIDEKGVDSNALWKAVKDVQKPEGKVISTDGEFISQKEAYAARQQYEISVLQAKLDVIGEERKQLLDVFEPSRLRSRLIGKAAERAAETDSCGWDTRLLWSDADWLIKSDEDETWEGYDGIPVTEGNTWWCPENSACERHEGWQDLLVQEFDKEQQIHVGFIYMFFVVEPSSSAPRIQHWNVWWNENVNSGFESTQSRIRKQGPALWSL